MSIEIRNLPYFDLSTVFQYSADQSDETQTPQVAVDYQGNTYRVGLPVFPTNNFEIVDQPGHTFKIGDAVQKQNDGSYALVQGATVLSESAIPLNDVTGIVTHFGSGSSVDKVTVTFNGRVTIGEVAGGRYETSLATGSIYYLSSGTPGLCTTAYPAGRQTFRPTFVALSTTQAYVIDDRASIRNGLFTDLLDVPSTMSGEGLKLVRVNSGGTALEFFSSPAAFGGAFINLSDVPASYSGAALNGVRVNAAGTALEFDPIGPVYLASPPVVAMPLGFSGTDADDILIASPSGAQKSAAATVVGDTQYNAVTSASVPAGTRFVILEAGCRQNGPDSSTNGRSFIFIRKNLASPRYLLLTGCASGGGDTSMNCGTGVFPLESDGSFYYSKLYASMNLGWYIKLIGYIR